MEEQRSFNDELKRVDNLSHYSFIEANQKFSFQQLVHIASSICETPVALISFLDSENQWVKASVGVSLEMFPSSLSACRITIQGDDLIEIEDLSQGDYMPFNDFLKTSGYRFYAGVPFKSPEGYNIGTVCVLDYVPRRLSRNQKEALKNIRVQIEELISLRKEYQLNLERFQDSEGRLEANHQEIFFKARTRAMAELSAGLSFRIRSHLKVINNVSQALPEEIKLVKTEEMETQINLLNEAYEGIEKILQSLDKFIIAEKEKSMKPFDLSNLLREVIKHLEYRFNNSSIQLEEDITSDVMCVGNPLQIGDAFYAVLMNAIEEVELSSEKVIKVHLKPLDHRALIRVCDSGRGIDEKYEPYIFQPFFTLKGPHGLGIGLSLAQAILKKHSGNISLEKKHGPTTFRIDIPVP